MMTPYYEMIHGPGGVGKSFEIKRRLAENPRYGLPMGTTGICSLNLDAVTIHSTFGYSDTQSLRDSYVRNFLHRAMIKPLKAGFEGFILSEFSMWDADQLDIIIDAFEHIQENVFPERQLKFIIEGDLGQLGPVKGKYCFLAKSWHKFEENITKLTKNWRAAGDDRFINFLHLYRLGRGSDAVDSLGDLRSSGLFVDKIDTSFQGTTILGKNIAVNNFNRDVMSRHTGKPFTVISVRKGKRLSQCELNTRTHEWGVKPKMELRIGAYVVIKSNQYQDDGNGGREILWANGDCGIITEIGPEDKEAPLGRRWIAVKLARNGEVVPVTAITRYSYAGSKPDKPLLDNYQAEKDPWMGKYRVGEITYFPIKLAYSSTVHSSQSLTLDRVQLDLRDPFMDFNSITYVALSRCRSLAGLRIVGSPELLAKRCKIDERVRRFL